jgi:hypothetical protein
MAGKQEPQLLARGKQGISKDSEKEIRWVD